MTNKFWHSLHNLHSWPSNLPFTSFVGNVLQKKKTSNMTANLTHAIMCVVLLKCTWNPEVQCATIRLLVTHGTRWQASLCPPTAPETVEDPCGCSWREQTKWEAGVQDSGFRHIPVRWQMAYSRPESKDPGHLVNFPWLGGMSISQTSRGTGLTHESFC